MGGIYGVSRSKDVFLLPPKESVNTADFGFAPNTAIVDNPTPMWVSVSPNNFVAPGVLGKVIPLTGGSTSLTASFSAPPGVTQPGLNSLATAVPKAHILFMEDSHPASAGITSSSGNQFVPLVTIALSGLGAVNVPLPPNVLSLLVLPLFVGANPQLNAIGVSSTTNYLNPQPVLFANTPVAITGLNSNDLGIQQLGNGINFSLTNGGMSATCTIFAEFFRSSYVSNNPNNPLYAIVTQNANGVVGPAFFQVANQNGTLSTGSVANGSTITVITAGALAVHTYLRKIEGAIQGVAGSTLAVECPIGTLRTIIDGTFTHPFNFDWDWLDCGGAAAVAIHNTSGVPSGAVNLHATANQT